MFPVTTTYMVFIYGHRVYDFSVTYIVDGNGNYIVDGNGNYMVV